MVLEEGIPDVFRHSGNSHHVTLTFLISLGTDAIVERDTVIPNQFESARGELAQSWVGIDDDDLLEQLYSSFVLVVNPWRIAAVLL